MIQMDWIFSLWADSPIWSFTVSGVDSTKLHLRKDNKSSVNTSSAKFWWQQSNNFSRHRVRLFQLLSIKAKLVGKSNKLCIAQKKGVKALDSRKTEEKN